MPGKKPLKQASKPTSDTFNSIFDSSTEAIIVCDPLGKIMLANPTSHSMFGYKKHELLQCSIEDLIPKRIRSKHTSYRKSFHSNPKPRRMGAGRDLVGLRKDGKEIPIEVSLNHTKIDGKPVAIAFLIDISIRKAIEDEVQKEKETTQMYLDVAGSIFLVLDRKNRIKMINHKGCQILGYNDETDLIGRSWLEHLPDPDRKIFKNIHKENIEEKEQKTKEFECKVISKISGEKVIFWQCELLPGSDKKWNSCIFSGVDVTGRKQAEEALRNSEEKLILYAAELEKRVKMRTEELAESVKNLEQINKALEKEVRERKKAEEEARKALGKERELSELKSRFVSMASHEFRTPLSTILSSASLIGKYEGEEMHEKRNRHVARIKDNVSDLTSILNDFLSLEKLEGGKLIKTPEKLEIIEFMEQMCEEFKLIAKEGQSIVFTKDVTLLEIVTDKAMLKNILNNLVSNAIKYSPEGKVITLRTKLSKNWVEITVADQGMGIPKQDQVHLFSRFFRAKNVMNIQGTGLGLNLVMRYLDLLGGEIWFESEEGKGSTFYFRIPINNE